MSYAMKQDICGMAIMIFWCAFIAAAAYMEIHKRRRDDDDSNNSGLAPA